MSGQIIRLWPREAQGEPLLRRVAKRLLDQLLRTSAYRYSGPESGVGRSRDPGFPGVPANRGLWDEMRTRAGRDGTGCPRCGSAPAPPTVEMEICTFGVPDRQSTTRVLAALSVLLLPPQARAAQEVTVEKGVIYASHQGSVLLADIGYPAAGDGLRPTII